MKFIQNSSTVIMFLTSLFFAFMCQVVKWEPSTICMQPVLPWYTASHAGRSRGAERKKLSCCSWGFCRVLVVSKSCGVQWRVNPSYPRSLSCPPSLSSLRVRKQHIQVTATSRTAGSLQKYHKGIVGLTVSQDIKINKHILMLLRCF